MNNLGSTNRNKLIEKAKNDIFDLVVIGGGITGAGIALDATLRGLKVLLLEKNDFAFGTSSRSTKLVHGGLRYLKNYEFGLVHELGVERAIVHKIAPHLTIPEKMLTPIVKNGTYGKLLTSIGIGIYDFLGKVKKDERRKMLTKSQTSECEPLLRNDILMGSALYFEYRTDDARLTIELIKTASKFGACCLNYNKVIDFQIDKNLIEAIIVKDEIKNEQYCIVGKCVVNASGPWVDEIRKIESEVKGKKLHHTKGIHLVVRHEKLPVKQAVYFDVFDGRMIFVIPRGEITYFGTTDTNYKQDLDHPDITSEDKKYLIDAVNQMFPSINLSTKDIISGWAGLRPLIHEDNKSASEISRKDEIFISKNGLISIAGGKLTGYRKMAEKVVDLVLKQIPTQKFITSNTSKHKLLGGDFENDEDVILKIKNLETVLKLSFDSESLTIAKRMIHLYGTQTDDIIRNFHKYSFSLGFEAALLKAEMKFSTEYESVQTLQDFFIRRTGIFYFNPLLMTNNINEACEWIKEFIPSKSENEIQKEKHILLEEYAQFDSNK